MKPIALLTILGLAASVALAQAPTSKDAKAKPAVAKAAPAMPAKTDAKPAAPAKATPAAPATGAIVANKDSKVFHRADCKTAARMKAENKTSFASAAEAAKAGYTACKVCKP